MRSAAAFVAQQGGAAPFDPTTWGGNIQAWWEGSSVATTGALIDAAIDLTTFARDITATGAQRPTLVSPDPLTGNRPSITWPATGNVYLTYPGPVADFAFVNEEETSIVEVVQFESQTTDGNLVGTAQSAADVGLRSDFDTSEQQVRAWISNGGADVMTFVSGATSAPQGFLLVLVWLLRAASADLWVNGRLAASGVPRALVPGAPTRALRVGARAGTALNNWRGPIAATLLFTGIVDPVLTTQQCRARWATRDTRVHPLILAFTNSNQTAGTPVSGLPGPLQLRQADTFFQYRNDVAVDSVDWTRVAPVGAFYGSEITCVGDLVANGHSPAFLKGERNGSSVGIDSIPANSWVPGFALWDDRIAWINGALARFAQLGWIHSIAGAFVDLGHRDAQDAGLAGNFGTNFSSLIANIRSEFGNIPIWFNRLSASANGPAVNLPFGPLVYAAQSGSFGPGVTMLDTDGYTCVPVFPFHFDPASIQQNGLDLSALVQLVI